MSLHSLRSHRFALPSLLLVETGLFLDWITTILAVDMFGVGVEANPITRQLLQGTMLAWTLLHLVGIFGLPLLVVFLHRYGRLDGPALLIVLAAIIVLGLGLTLFGINNLIYILTKGKQ